MASNGHNNFIAGASDVAIGRLLMAVAGGRTLIHTAATTSVPTHISLCAVDVSEDPVNALKYERLESGKIYELVASAEIASGAKVTCTAAGKAVTHASADNYFFIALDADGSADGKTFSAQYVGPTYYDAS